MRKPHWDKERKVRWWKRTPKCCGKPMVAQREYDDGVWYFCPKCGHEE